MRSYSRYINKKKFTEQRWIQLLFLMGLAISMWFSNPNPYKEYKVIVPWLWIELFLFLFILIVLYFSIIKKKVMFSLQERISLSFLILSVLLAFDFALFSGFGLESLVFFFIVAAFSFFDHLFHRNTSLFPAISYIFGLLIFINYFPNAIFGIGDNYEALKIVHNCIGLLTVLVCFFLILSNTWNTIESANIVIVFVGVMISLTLLIFFCAHKYHAYFLKDSNVFYIDQESIKRRMAHALMVKYKYEMDDSFLRIAEDYIQSGNMISVFNRPNKTDLHYYGFPDSDGFNDAWARFHKNHLKMKFHISSFKLIPKDIQTNNPTKEEIQNLVKELNNSPVGEIDARVLSDGRIEYGFFFNFTAKDNLSFLSEKTADFDLLLYSKNFTKDSVEELKFEISLREVFIKDEKLIGEFFDHSVNYFKLNQYYTIEVLSFILSKLEHHLFLKKKGDPIYSLYEDTYSLIKSLYNPQLSDFIIFSALNCITMNYGNIRPVALEIRALAIVQAYLFILTIGFFTGRIFYQKPPQTGKRYHPIYSRSTRFKRAKTVRAQKNVSKL